MSVIPSGFVEIALMSGVLISRVTFGVAGVLGADIFAGCMVGAVVWLAVGLLSLSSVGRGFEFSVVTT